MKRHSTYIIIAFLFLSLFSTGWAQNSYPGQFRFNDLQIVKQENKLTLNLILDMSSVDLANQLMVELTPVMRLNDNSASHEFAPVIIVGTARNKALNRELGLHNFSYKVEPQQYVVRRNKQKQSVPVILTVTYAEWMRDAELVFTEKVSGCANCDLEEKLHTVTDRILSPLFVPAYELLYVQPEAEPVKQRSETYAAHLNYRVGKYELLRDFENNAHVLNQVDQIVGELRNDDDLTLQTLTVTGYASPEGNYNSNLELSKNRAYSFVSYLEKAHGLNASIMKTDWKGEDWNGLLQVVSASSLTDRDAVIRIISEQDDITKRKQSLRTLNGGETYRILLRDYYPPLRRNEYTIAYVARPFNLEEAKLIVKTKPQYLSLNEMFLVANTYPKGSTDFNEVFDIAARLFPDDPIANLNAAAQEIEMGALNKAIDRLNKIDYPEALNNLGVAYAKKGEYIQATDCFEKATKQGNTTAQSNLEQLKKFLKN